MFFNHNWSYKYLKLFKICFLIILLNASSLFAQSSAEILFDLQKLNTLGSVLYIAAHPDDENTRLLSYLSKERKYRTAYLSLTRGDGGQNLIGKEQSDHLGIIRTQELIQARKVDGGEQFFTRAKDFGYSKTPDETIRIWHKNEVLFDMVWIIRNFKPDVIICRFPTTGEGGHGHHTASAILAMEAFDLAADPNAFPEQLGKTQVWKTKRMYWNTFNFGTVNTTDNKQLKINVGGYNTLLGKSYGEIASESRTMHKSQGFGTAKQRGNSIEYFKYMKGDTAINDLFEGIQSNWMRVEKGKTIQSEIQKAIKAFNLVNPEINVANLLNILKTINQTKDQTNAHWLTFKQKELEQIILKSLGVYCEINASDYSLCLNQEFSIQSQIIMRNKGNLVLNKLIFPDGTDTVYNFKLNENETLSNKRKIKLPSSLPYTAPYWLSASLNNDDWMRNLLMPSNPPALKLTMVLSIYQQTFELPLTIQHKSIDPTKGEVFRPIEVLPNVVFTAINEVEILNNINEKTIRLSVKAIKDIDNATLVFKPNESLKLDVLNNSVQLKKGAEYVFEVKLTVLKPSETILLVPYVEVDGQQFNQLLTRIEYEHIGQQIELKTAAIKICNFNVKITNNQIAYFEGAGDKVAQSLMQLGYNVVFLTEQQLKQDNLSQYAAVVFGIRAFNVNENLHLLKDKLLAYTKNGGNIIVQYNTNSRVGPIQNMIMPYSFDISRNRVTDENAPIKLLAPQHPALKSPNLITNADFDDWIQERGIYFAHKLDSNFVDLFAMNDPGEKDLTGGLIVAPFGKGNFVYTGLSFFRQLPHGVHGAAKLFVNLINLPNNE
ncbi:MAG: PIG-L family deacetylase [Bacteroidota bacterium]|nr:PIG-L family deacetylase [Bacteroidota bacterium]